MRNLVYLIGIPKDFCYYETLQSYYFFGQFGPIKKLIVKNDNRVNNSPGSAYITFEKEISAALAILTIDGINFKNKFFKASFGMTKYCSFFLKGNKCPKQECLFLHRIADKGDIVTVKNKISQKVHVSMSKEDVINYCLNLGAEEIRNFEIFMKNDLKSTKYDCEQYKYWAKVIPSVVSTVNDIKKQFKNKFIKSIYENNKSNTKKNKKKYKSVKNNEQNLKLSGKRSTILKW